MWPQIAYYNVNGIGIAPQASSGTRDNGIKVHYMAIGY